MTSVSGGRGSDAAARSAFTGYYTRAAARRSIAEGSSTQATVTAVAARVMQEQGPSDGTSPVDAGTSGLRHRAEVVIESLADNTIPARERFSREDFYDTAATVATFAILVIGCALYLYLHNEDLKRMAHKSF